jgi:hypothetical protein
MARLTKAEEITAVWNALADEPRSGEGWMAITVATSGPCVVKAGRYFPGNEEAVLVGFPSLVVPQGEQLPEGKGFSVRRVTLGQDNEGRRWIALQRLPPGTPEMFTMMAADVVSVLEGMGAAAESLVFSTFLIRVRAWQNFMQRGNDGVLSREAETGLYGELLVLETLLQAGVAADRVVDAWVGPLDAVQDFLLGSGAIEVKTTVAAGVFPACISSLEQLDDSCCKPLFLAAVRTTISGTGSTLPERIAAVSERLGAEILPAFEVRLLEAGYFQRFADRYLRRFGDASMRIIHVGDVPRLLHATVPPGVLRVRYEIDIDSIPAGDLSLEQALQLLGGL